MPKEKITITNEDNASLMMRLEDESIDIICIDPPYLYLKNQKLERPFDEQLFFSECKRLLTKDGFIIMFGRGESFYRWNTILSDIGFKFKEEIIWDKGYSSSPVLPLQRFHETISIFCNGESKINKVNIPYLEQKQHNIDGIITDVKRIASALKSDSVMKDLINYFESKKRSDYTNNRISNHNVSVNGASPGNQAVTTFKSINDGMNEKSIIKTLRDHYSTIHPTQKPVRLIERLIALVLPDKPKDKITVADFFGGSMSTMEACYNIGVNGISCEIDKEYFDLGEKRIHKLSAQQSLF